MNPDETQELKNQKNFFKETEVIAPPEQEVPGPTTGVSLPQIPLSMPTKKISSISKWFKESKLGGSLTKLGGKLSTALTVLQTSWGALKKLWEKVKEFLLGLIATILHFGAAAAYGALVGFLAGLVPAFVAAANVFGWVAGGLSFLGPIGWIAGGVAAIITFVVIEMGFTGAGAAAGVYIQSQIDKAKLSQANVGQSIINTNLETAKAAEGLGGISVGASIAAPLAATTLGLYTIYSAFLPPPGEEARLIPRQSAYIEVTKTAIPKKLENSQLPADINYAITISSQQGQTIRITSITNSTTARKEDETIPIEEDKFGKPITSFGCGGEGQCNCELGPGETCNIQYTITATTNDPDLSDSLIFDVITVTADVPGKDLTGEQESASASVIIGNPPMDCPREWPVLEIDPIVISQGPNGTFSHQNLEAIDIVGSTPGEIRFKEAIATHQGTAYTQIGRYGNKIVTIVGQCKLENGQVVEFSSIYAHLFSFEVNDGDSVVFGQTIGLVDNTGWSTGDHLHYEFRTTGGGGEIRMEQPFLPVNIPRGDYCQTHLCSYPR
jgi:hypothetical protein